MCARFEFSCGEVVTFDPCFNEFWNKARLGVIIRSPQGTQSNGCCQKDTLHVWLGATSQICLCETVVACVIALSGVDAKSVEPKRKPFRRPAESIRRMDDRHWAPSDQLANQCGERVGQAVDASRNHTR